MLTLESILRVERLEQTYKDSPKYPVRIGYLKVDRETGEVKTYDLHGHEDKPIQIEFR